MRGVLSEIILIVLLREIRLFDSQGWLVVILVFHRNGVLNVEAVVASSLNLALLVHSELLFSAEVVKVVVPRVAVLPALQASRIAGLVGVFLVLVERAIFVVGLLLLVVLLLDVDCVVG